MMNAPTLEAMSTITRAQLPGDLFASPASARQTYHALARLVHPDLAPPSLADEAKRAFAKLAALYASALATAHAGNRAPMTPTVIKTNARAYTTLETLCQGDIANLILVRFEEDDEPSTGVLKLARAAENADLIQAEAGALRTIAANVEAIYLPFFPEILESLVYREDPASPERAANVLRDLPGFVTLADIGRAYPAGLDVRDVAWMWRRLLTALGAAHKAGLIHGAVTPEHILIEPVEHGLVLVDWCYTTDIATRSPLRAIVPDRADLYPPEILAREPASPASDIFMATKVMESLLDASAPPPIRAFARGCMHERVADRPDDAWSLLSELDGLLVRLFGPHQFRPFPWPAPGTTATP